ncbi:hybrid sensor histidine kinase/response regulator [Bradyrhizobium embrapense]|uniref:hybrid sensor histidine kinase/response regulator n=1 Tax=Bradyrhizobium embrapense TaxID=630921 RepID=UPI000A05B86B|nr:PAS domain-containing sensor histidine kinase [Bradyrhizobium embrapense]
MARADEKGTEKSLRPANGDQFRGFVEYAPVAIAMFDREMRYLAASRRWIDDYGLLGKIEGRSHYEVFPEIPQAWREIHQRAMNGETCSSDEERFERVDGTVHWLRWDVRPWFGPDGDIGGILILTEDITRRRAAEEELRRDRELLRASEDRYRAIFEAAPNPIILIDARGIIEAVNPAMLAVFGYQSGELLGKNVALLMPEADAMAHDGYLRRYAETGQGNIIGIGREVTARRKNGTVFPAELAITTWRNENGAQLYCGTLSDVTERKQAERLVAERQRLDAVGLLAGGVAHDFNNSLAVILGNLELAEPRIGDRVAQHLVSRSLQAAKMASTVTRRLLALARKPEGEWEIVSLNDVVRETVPLLESLVAGQWALRLDLLEELWPTRVPAGELCSALLNLAANSRDAMPEGGNITIATRNMHVTEEAGTAAPGRFVCLSVTDTGEGMPADVLHKVWEPFYSTKKPGRGTGLGLTTVKNLAKLAGGFAKIASAPGRGTTVTLHFPCIEAAISAQMLADPLPIPFGDGEAILVVDDDDEVREIAMKRLEALGYVALEARTGEEAVTTLRNDDAIDLVFADVVMPGMSGYQLAKWIRAHRPRTAVVLTSGYPGEVSTGESSNGSALLLKPYSREQLARSIEQALAARPAPAI